MDQRLETFFRSLQDVPSLELIEHLKINGWKTSFLLGWPIFRGELLALGSA